MPIFDLFSKRQKKLTKDQPDVYKYDEIPQFLKVQIVHIINDTIGHDRLRTKYASPLYKKIDKILCKEYGVIKLTEDADSHHEAICNFLLTCNECQKCLDVIELTFLFIKIIEKRYDYCTYQRYTSSEQTPADAINELNERFKEAGIGYEFHEGKIIRIDSQLIHAEIVKPALSLLKSSKYYAGANDEFLTAHKHYRHKKYMDCLIYCLKSFESLMKAICEKHGWKYNKKSDTASKLIGICLNNGLMPEYMQSQFSNFQALLESGVPTLRNKEGGHGQGVEIKKVPEHYASYCLHLTASNLLFLANCEEQMQK